MWLLEDGIYLWLVLYLYWTDPREKTLCLNSSQHSWPSCLGQWHMDPPCRVVLWNPVLWWHLPSGGAGEQWVREVALNCCWEEQPQGAGHQAGSCLVSGLVSNSHV